MLDIFNSDAFSVIRMTEAMREVAYVPSRIGQLGLFQAESVDTLDVAIEKADKESLILVPASPRGGPGGTRDHAKRSLRKLSVPHFQRDDAIYADEIMQVRAFGSETAVETLQGKIARKAANHSQDFALTEEYHRLNVIKNGTLLDADGSVIYNYFTEFGESQPAEIAFDLDAASPVDGALLDVCAKVYEGMTATLDGLPFTGIRALCSSSFFKKLRKHKEVRETYKYQEGANLRRGIVENGSTSLASGTMGQFEFGDITWEWYRGNTSAGITADKVHFVAEGVPGLFKTIYAPADYLETVNRPGQRLYAKQYEMRNGKGIELEFQMNALHYCTRPRTLLRGKAGA